jgi:hypothetical protein
MVAIVRDTADNSVAYVSEEQYAEVVRLLQQSRGLFQEAERAPRLQEKVELQMRAKAIRAQAMAIGR